MKKLYKILALIILVASILFITNSTFATSETLNSQTSEEQTHTPDPETAQIDNAPEMRDVYRIDERVITSQNISGNLFATAKKVVINNSYIDGDIFVAADEVKISSTTVKGNIFVAGKTIKIENQVTAKEIYAAAKDIKTSENVVVKFALRACGQNIELNGKFNELHLAGENIVIKSGAIVTGVLNYTSNKEAVIEQGAEVDEELIEFNKTEEINFTFVQLFNFILFAAVTLLVTIVVLSLLFIFWDKNYNKFIKSNSAWSNIWKSFLIGFVSIIIIPVIAVISLITGIGCYISLIIMLLFALIIVFSSTSTVTLISNMIFNRGEEEKKSVEMFFKTLLVAIVYVVICFIPYVGECFAFVSITIGMGNLLRRFFYKAK